MSDAKKSASLSPSKQHCKVIDAPKEIGAVPRAVAISENDISLAAMKDAMQPKSKHQKSEMWEFVVTLNPKVKIKNKNCNLGCRICYKNNLAVGCMAANRRPLNF